MPTIKLPWSSPPLTANQRHHWRAKARITANIRTATKLLTRNIPPQDHITVQLVWHVNTRHRRDVDNIVPTLKPICDALVDAGIVPDDTPQYMTKMMPEIIYNPSSTPHLTLDIL